MNKVFGKNHSCNCIITYMLLLLVAQSRPTLLNPMDCSMPGFPVLHHLLQLTQTHVHLVSDAIQPFVLCHPLLLLPLLFPSIRVFPMSWALCIRWPKYWGFSFSISPSNVYSGLISFRMDWCDPWSGSEDPTCLVAKKPKHETEAIL